jgi:hypothetical protein
MSGLNKKIVLTAAFISLAMKKTLNAFETKQIAKAFVDNSSLENDEIEKIVPYIIKNYFEQDDGIIMQNYIRDQLKEKDKPNYINLEKNIKISGETQIVFEKLKANIEKDVLRPRFIDSYIILDSMYLDYPFHLIYGSLYIQNTRCTNTFSWQLTNNLINSSDANVTLKYPISNVISIEILPFYLPPCCAFDDSWIINPPPPNKRIFITIPEISESYTSLASEAYTIPAVLEKDSAFLDGVIPNRLYKCTPVNNGKLIFRFTQTSLSSLTFSFNNGVYPMLFLPIHMLGRHITSNGTTAIITLVDGTSPKAYLVEVGELVIFRNAVASDPILDATYLSVLQKRTGWVATEKIPGYSFRINFDISGMAGTFTEFQVYVPARRITIPIILTQLRPDMLN